MRFFMGNATGGKNNHGGTSLESSQGWRRESEKPIRLRLPCEMGHHEPGLREALCPGAGGDSPPLPGSREILAGILHSALALLYWKEGVCPGVGEVQRATKHLGCRG